MQRPAIVLFIVWSSLGLVAQTSSPVPTSDPQAVSFAQQSIIALAGGVQISDVTLNANVISVSGSDNESGTGTFSAKGFGESRVDLNLNERTESDVRNITNGIPAGAWTRNGSTATAYAQHNCWSNAAWFFPALSLLAQTPNAGVVFKYVGPETHNGISVQHIQFFKLGSNDGGILQNLSTTHVYLDSHSHLPLAIAFNAHADNSMNINLPTEIRFANYQSVNGIQVPFHFQKLINGSVALDVTVTSAAFNSGLLDSLFTIQ